MSNQSKFHKLVRTIIKSNYFKLFIYSNVTVSVVGVVALMFIGDGGYEHETRDQVRLFIAEFACFFVFSWGVMNIAMNWFKDSKNRIIGIMQMIQGATTLYFVPLWFFFTPSVFIILLCYYLFL